LLSCIKLNIYFFFELIKNIGLVPKIIETFIRKINFGTDLCYAFLDTVFAVDRAKIGIDLFMAEPIQAVADFAASKIELLGAAERA
jgi:fructose/tagatose bisphosphate aldolase